jgi:rubrerythrin
MAKNGISNWAALGIAIVVVLAAVGGYHVIDLRNDLKDALQSEYAAIELYTELGSQKGIFSQKNSAYAEIAKDEQDHVIKLEKYVSAEGANNTYEVSSEGAIQSEKDAIAQYQDLLNKVYLYRGLKEDLQHILEDEKAHLGILQAGQEGPVNKLSGILRG